MYIVPHNHGTNTASAWGFHEVNKIALQINYVAGIQHDCMVREKYCILPNYHQGEINN